MPGHAMPGDVWSLSYLGASFFMWALMMVAMMLPSAAPMILLYGRNVRRSAVRPLLYMAVFVLSYLAIWTFFSAAAAFAQAVLVSTDTISEMALAVGDARMAGALLLSAGLYQLSPMKRACLDQCRSPLSFIMRFSRRGPAGALRLGMAHGFYCLGCCWALMLLLFAGGVMNIAWIAAIALAVLAEKMLPPRFRAREAIAALLLLAGAILIAGFTGPL